MNCYLLDLTNSSKYSVAYANEIPKSDNLEDSILEIQLNRAQDLVNRGELDQAIQIYVEIIQQNPDLTQARKELALVYAYNKQYKESISLYTGLVAEEPDNLKLRLELAEIKSWAKKYRDSLKDYEVIIEKYPDSINARLGYAQVLSWVEKYDRSLKEYGLILQSQPDNLQALKGEAEVTYWSGKNQKSIILYQKALEKYPQNSQLDIGLARVYYAEKYISRAIEVLQPHLDAKNDKALNLLSIIRSRQAKLEAKYLDNTSGEESYRFSQNIGFRIDDSDTLYELTTGFGSLDQPFVESVNNYFLDLGIERKLEPVLFSASLGVDFFNRLAAVPRFNLDAEIPLASNLDLSTALKFGAYKHNALTLENEVNTLSLEHNLTWLIDTNSWLYFLYKLGFYNDGNLENQIGFSLGRNLGQFFVGGNLFYFGFQDDLDNGYFDPPDFFSFNGEIGWKSKVLDFSECLVSASLGQQSFEGNVQNSQTYKAGCKITFTPNSEFDIFYRFSNNARFQNSATGSSEQEILSGTLRFLF